ncbi:MAG: bifunctional hydroxymethylpyrimidine kinase/phosphomethylpyrimidine kinase [Actinomycetota bacterium]
MGSPAEPVTGMPVAMTIAGSDSSGGAGIQVDLKVFFALGCHGTSALTALTAQNTVGVTGIHEVPPGFVREQVDAVVVDMDVAAAKTGMLGSAAIVTEVARAVEDHGLQLVVDPVFISKHRSVLLAEDAIGALRRDLIPRATVVTPNLHEAEGLTGLTVTSVEEMKAAAEDIARLGPRAVLIKGGHLGEETAVDVLWHDGEITLLEAPRYDTTDTHGTGCALAASITARLAHGDELPAAVAFAKEFISGAIRHSLRLGKGFGPVNPGWRLDR